MQIAVLSGKGGTGKTFVSVNLAAAAAVEKPAYLDCDVEEPNGYLFLKPEIDQKENVDVPVPEFDIEKCDGCRTCVQFCRFNALAFVKGKPLLFPELCHSCSGCTLICHSKAVREKKRTVGVIEKGRAGEVSVFTGILNQGEATGVPVIRRLLKEAPKTGTVIIDCPPGSSCTVMESIRDADFCLLVAEPTLFGLANLKLVVQLVKTFHIPCGILINKENGETGIIESLAEEYNIPVFAKIPYDKALARKNASGELAVKSEKYGLLFRHLYEEIIRSAGGGQ